MAAVVITEEPSWLAFVAVAVFVATPFVVYIIVAILDHRR